MSSHLTIGEVLRKLEAQIASHQDRVGGGDGKGATKSALVGGGDGKGAH